MLRTKIQEIIEYLNISECELKEVNKLQWQSIIDKIEENFITKEKHDIDTYPYWERLKGECFNIYFEEDDAYKSLDLLINRDETVWLLLQDDAKLWLYEGNIETIKKVIGECYAFEYYLISKKYSWLLCENHHGYLIGVGNPIVDRMRKLQRWEG